MPPIDTELQLIIHRHSLGSAVGACIVTIFLIYTVAYYTLAERDLLGLYIALLEATVIVFLTGFAVYASADSPEAVRFWTLVCYTGATLTPATYHLLIVRVTERHQNRMSVALVLVWTLAAILLWLDPGYLITESVKNTSGHPSMVKGPLFKPYVLALFASILGSFWLFLTRFRRDAEFRQEAWPLMVGFLAWILGSIYDALNAAGVISWGTIPWAGPVAMLMLVGLYVGRVTIGTRRHLERLNREKELLYQQMIRDDLSGLYSRSYFHAELHRRIGSREREPSSQALLFVDIDGFKNVNDRFGHPMGDRIVELVGGILTSRSRGADVPARVGGDEFMLYLDQTNAQEADARAREIRDDFVRLVGESFAHAADSLGLSIGVASAAQNETADAVWARADVLMYRAKAKGRNRVATEAELES